MNETILEGLNSNIAVDDELYFLGDFAFGNKKQIPVLRERIKCRTIHLHYGNHDETLAKYYTSCFTTCQHYNEFRYKRILFTLLHYPIGSWNELGRGSINIFGHCHSNYSRVIGRQLDVGVDANNFKPISIDEVLERMLAITPVEVDHHNKDS